MEGLIFGILRYSTDRDQGLGIRLITAVSVIKRLILYEFTLWGRDSASVIGIREREYYRGFFKENI